jgi:hypothetical protein
MKEEAAFSFCRLQAADCRPMNKKEETFRRGWEGFLVFRDLSWSQGPKRKGDCLRFLD